MYARYFNAYKINSLLCNYFLSSILIIPSSFQRTLIKYDGNLANHVFLRPRGLESSEHCIKRIV